MGKYHLKSKFWVKLILNVLFLLILLPIVCLFNPTKKEDTGVERTLEEGPQCVSELLKGLVGSNFEQTKLKRESVTGHRVVRHKQRNWKNWVKKI